MAQAGLHTASSQPANVKALNLGHAEGSQMTQAQKRVAPKTGKTVTTLAQAIAAYGGRGPFREAFCISDDQLDDWQRWGEIPRGAQLGLLLGLKARGYTMAPQLVGVDTWADVAGV
jgi:hypothetical protein